MNRRLARFVAWSLALLLGASLSGCGDDKHKHMDHSGEPGTYK